MLPFPRCLLTPAPKTHLHHHLTFHAPVIALTSLDSPLSSSVHVYLPAHALHLYPPRSSIFLSHFKHIYCIYTHTHKHTRLRCPLLIKELKHMQVSATLLFLLFPTLLSSSPLCASLLSWSCVLWTQVGTWLKARATSLLYCPAHSLQQHWRLSCAEWPFVASPSLQQVPYSKRQEPASQPASSHCFVSAAHPLMCSFHQMETAAKEDAKNHLKNKNIPLRLVKDKLQFQW